MARGEPGEDIYRQETNAAEVLPRKLIPEVRRPNEVGGAVERFGGAMEEVARQNGIVQASKAMADARVAVTQAYSDAQTKYQPGDDFTGDMAKMFRQYHDQALGSIQNPFAKQALDRQLTGFGADIADNAIRFQAHAQVANRVQGQKDATDTTAIAVRADPSQFERAYGERLSALQAADIPPEEKNQLVTHARDSLSLNGALGLATSNPGEVYRELTSGKTEDPILSRLIDPASRAHVLEKATGEMVKQEGDAIVNEYRQGGPKVGAQAYASIDKMELPEEIKDQVRAHVQQGLMQREHEAREQYAPQIQSVEERILSGQPQAGDRAAVMDLGNKGVWNAQEQAARLAAIDRAEQKGAGDTAGRDWAQQHYALGIPADPASKEVRDAFDDFFKTSFGAAFPAGSAGWTNGAALIARQTGVVPDTVLSWTRAQIISGDPKAAAVAADSLQRLAEASPRGIGFMGDGYEKTKAIASEIWRMTQSGTDPERAVEIARRNAELPEGERKLLDEKFRKSVPGGGVPGGYMEAHLISILKDDPSFKPGMFSSVPSIPPTLTAQFSNLTHDYYLMTGGNATQAAALAARDIKAVWGVSTVNGSREILQYPPEKTYGLKDETIRDDISATLKEAKIDADAAKARLVFKDGLTDRTQGQKWQLAIPGKDGSYDVVANPDGTARTYTLPVEDQTAALRAHQEKAIAETKAAQDKMSKGDERMGELFKEAQKGTGVWH